MTTQEAAQAMLKGKKASYPGLHGYFATPPPVTGHRHWTS